MPVITTDAALDSLETDPWAFVSLAYVPGTVSSAIIALIAAGLIGGALSIRRITSVDPMIALGRER